MENHLGGNKMQKHGGRFTSYGLYGPWICKKGDVFGSQAAWIRKKRECFSGTRTFMDLEKNHA